MTHPRNHIRNGILLSLLAAGIAVPTAQGEPPVKNGTDSPSTSARGSREIRSESRANLQSALALGTQRSGEIRSESRARLESALALRSQRSGEIRSESVPKLQTARALAVGGSGEIRSESRTKLRSALALGMQRFGEIRSESRARLESLQPVTVNGDGFDWRNTGIGVGVAFGLAMLLGAFAISRRRQSHAAV